MIFQAHPFCEPLWCVYATYDFSVYYKIQIGSINAQTVAIHLN